MESKDFIKIEEDYINTFEVSEEHVAYLDKENRLHVLEVLPNTNKIEKVKKYENMKGDTVQFSSDGRLIVGRAGQDSSYFAIIEFEKVEK